MKLYIKLYKAINKIKHNSKDGNYDRVCIRVYVCVDII